MRVSLLYPDRNFAPDGPLCADHDQLYADLQLEILVAAMADGDPLVARVSKSVLLQPLDDPDVIVYRQAILADFRSHPQLLEALRQAATAALQARRDVWGFGYGGFPTPQGTLSGAARYLAAYIDPLRTLRAIADTHIGAGSAEGLTRLLQELQSELQDSYLEIISRHLHQLNFRRGIWLSAELGDRNTGDNYALVAPHPGSDSWTHRLHSSRPASYRFSIDPHDDGAGQALEELTAKGLNQVANAAAQSADHITSYLNALQTELAFYRGCLNLYQRLQGNGQQVCTPQVAQAVVQALNFTGLTDPCLGLQAGGLLDGHDADADRRSLVVITGANSGGKSTLLRSVGVAQLMMQAGMLVTANSYRASPVAGVFTHFPHQEDATMSRGRLDDELSRMEGIARHLRPYCLVLFNESFQSTNEREGSEIASQIVTALRDAGVRVVYVTHQYDFARRFLDEADTSTLYLRAAPRSPVTPHYRIEPDLPLATAYGPELYRSVFADSGSA
jgi:DNA mismatch repair ATPase MutS